MCALVYEQIHLHTQAFINVCMLAQVFLCMYVCVCRAEVTVLPQDNRGPKEPPGPHTDPVEPLSIEQQLHTALQWTDVTGCEQEVLFI